MNLYTAAAKSYAKAVRDLNKRDKPTMESQKTGGLLARDMTRKPKMQDAPKDKQPYDIVLDAMRDIRKYRSEL